MNRRGFLQTLGATGLTACTSGVRKPSPYRADVHIVPGHTTSSSLTSALGMSYDAAVLEDPDWLSAHNFGLVERLRALAPNFVLRIASAAPPRAPYPAATPAEDETLGRLADFVTVIDARLIFGLPAIEGNLDASAHQARVLAQRLGSRLMAVQLADEPDLFHDREFEPHHYGFDRFIGDWRLAAAHLRSTVPNLPLAGPDVSAPYDWIESFGHAAGDQASFLSGHYFPLGAPKSNSATLSSMIRSQTDDRFVDLRNGLQQAVASKLPYRLTATNLCTASGKPGISDSFASALWFTKLSLDVFRLGGAGLCIHGGIDNASSTFARTADGSVTTRALGLALQLLSAALPGQLVECVVKSGNLLLFVAAIRGGDGSIKVILVNQDSLHAVDALLSVGTPVKSGHSLRLIAPTLYETENFSLEARDGREPSGLITLTADGAQVTVSPASVLLVTLIPT